MARLTRRLDGLFPTLTATERAILVLQAWKEGRPQDPLVGSTVPAGQWPDFAKLQELVRQANDPLGDLILVIELMVEKLQVKHAWLASVLLLTPDADDFPRNPGTTGVAADPLMGPGAGRELARMLRQDICSGIAKLWREVRIVENIWEQIGQALGGEDPVRPSLRGQATRTKRTLEELRENIEPCSHFVELLEPDEDEVIATWRSIASRD